MSERDRVETWNLDCVRQHGIGKDQYVGRISSGAEFSVRDDQFFVLGDIDDGFFDRFRQALGKSSRVKTVALGSGGGNVRDAILAGLLIREKGLNTTLNSDCYSACSLIFLGGVNRNVLSPYPRLGFHQASAAGKALPPSNDVYRVVRDYERAMAADSELVLAFMHKAKPEDMHYPDVWDLCEPRITTWVQRGC